MTQRKCPTAGETLIPAGTLLLAVAAASFALHTANVAPAGEKVELLRIIETNPREEVVSVAFGADDKTLMGATDSAVVIWDMSDGAERKRWQAKSGRVLAAAFSPDRKIVALGAIDGPVMLYEPATGREVARYALGREQITSLSFSGDGNLLAAGDLGWRIRVWDVAKARPVAVFGGTSPVLAVAMSPDGALVGYGSTAGNFDVFDLETKERTAGLNERTTAKKAVSHQGSLNAVAFSPTGKILATGSVDRTVKLWDVETGTVAVTLTGHQDEILSVVFGPDGKVLASGSSDRTVRLWDVPTGKIVAVLEGSNEAVKSVAIGSRGTLLASTGSRGAVKVWKMRVNRE